MDVVVWGGGKESPSRSLRGRVRRLEAPVTPPAPCVVARSGKPKFYHPRPRYKSASDLIPAQRRDRSEYNQRKPCCQRGRQNLEATQVLA
jgi:hypothetical protein